MRDTVLGLRTREPQCLFGGSWLCRGCGGALSDDGKAGSLQGQMWGKAHRLCPGLAIWAKGAPRALHTLKSKLLVGWLMTLRLVSALTWRRTFQFHMGALTLLWPCMGPCPLPAFPGLRFAPAALTAPLGAGLDGGCCASPAPLPALISLWKSQSLLQIQLWFWGQPSPSPSLSSSLLLLSFLLLSLPPLRTVLSGGSGYRCSISSHLHPGGWESGAEGEGCGGQAE